MITIEDYNEKCIAVFGTFTTEILTRLKALNGLENTKLKTPDSDIKRTGWVFPKSKRAILETQLSKHMNGSPEPETPKQSKSSSANKLNLPPSSVMKSTETPQVKSIEIEVHDQQVYTKKEINAIVAKLVARIEALETELGYSKTLSRETPKTKKVQRNDYSDDEEEESGVPLFKQLI